MKRRTILARLLLAGAVALGAAQVQAQAWPAKPLHLLVGFSAGSGTDLVARRLAEGLASALGQPVLVENLPGAGSTLAAARAAKAAPDGYTLYLADFSHAIAPALYATLPYDTVADFTAVAPVSRFQFVLVASRKSGLDSATALVAAARREPGKLSFGSSGNGSALHLIGQVFGARTQSRFLHVPYRGGGDVLNALVAGDLDFAFFPSPPLAGFVQTGKLRVIGVPGAARDPQYPDVPTLEEQDVRDFDAFTWNILMAPRGTPPAIVDRVAAAVAQVSQSAAFREGIAAQGARPLAPLSPAQTAAFLADEVRTWGPVVKASGAVPQ